MKLDQPGTKTGIPVKRLKLRMQWHSPVDFDLAALYLNKNADYGLIYFADLGDVDSPPYMQLSDDDGVGGLSETQTLKEEILEISRLDEIDKIWIFCWDYEQLKKGLDARFTGSDIHLEVSASHGHWVSIPIQIEHNGNIVCIAVIDNTEHTQRDAQLINYNQISKLQSLDSISQLIELVT
ncbi:hypothetical protein [Candidatus Venteria ishoeyi]|uniref:Uncharacterized protein n=1 Tax=Candidatus Venteria ishoeyi TaxID=1899563 RepID=A0A1H6FHR6_9GAMM|nr:hypothetical protein [Candidatus Venteria ishoeyi]MDM8546709.1 hypothetical protein [Candidatus Venteria ishoeyi]SEH08595.1 Uncharacterised protein [Candidatus Venteria ishoeyi]